ncbi:holo-ACP synthase [Oceanobacillus halotolerans]|uniref:holo-ACP synthase n=1 Tax=Oceanobacillus halotolerans TaxID=2663380 RepID=UPI0013DC7D0A|nr:holo-ACP synthase [Oceanobacillus halotolerans]
MIKGIGIDLLELDRIEKSLEKSNRLAKRVLTNRELKKMNELEHNHRKVEFLAGRFAAKEAFAKAIGTGIGKLSFKHMEVSHDQNGAPMMKVKGYETNTIFVSISHSKNYVVAQIVIEEK